MGPKVRMHFFIKGTIRDGGFSEVVQKVAQDLGVNGKIKHHPDKRIEIIAEGERHILEHFWQEIWEEIKYGEGAIRLPNIQLPDIQTTWEEATGEFSGFRVR